MIREETCLGLAFFSQKIRKSFHCLRGLCFPCEYKWCQAIQMLSSWIRTILFSLVSSHQTACSEGLFCFPLSPTSSLATDSRKLELIEFKFSESWITNFSFWQQWVWFLLRRGVNPRHWGGSPALSAPKIKIKNMPRPSCCTAWVQIKPKAVLSLCARWECGAQPLRQQDAWAPPPCQAGSQKTPMGISCA